MKNFSQWEGFKGNRWKEKIDVRNFISMNYTPYDGDASFLEEPTEATNKLWGKLQELQKEERAKGGVLDMETEVVTSLTAYGPGYIDKDLKDLEKVVGLQTDKPLKRAFMPYGGIKMAEKACEMYGYKVDPQIHDMFTKFEYLGNTFSIGLCGDLWDEKNVMQIKKLRADVVLWPVYTDFSAKEWNKEMKYEYAAQSKKIGRQVLLVNSVCLSGNEEELAKGGAVCFLDGQIKEELPAGKEGVLMVQV